jgi:CRP/FNR family cyclic AMP-dependent transcriptional regulator
MVFLELFSHNPEVIKVPAGAALFRAGEEGHQMYVLSTGTAEVIVNDRVVETLQHGSVIGEVSMLLPGPHSASVIAVTACEFVAVDEKRFQFLVQQTPFFATQVMRMMAERLLKTNQMVAATVKA